MKKVVISVFKLCLMLLALIMPMFIGYWLCEYSYTLPFAIPLAIILILFALFWIFGCTIANWIYSQRYQAQVRGTSPKEFQDYALAEKDEIQSNLKKEERNVTKLIKKARAYNTTLILANFVLSVGIALLVGYLILLDDSAASVPKRLFVPFPFYVVFFDLFAIAPWGVFYNFNRERKNRIHSLFLSSNQYPTLFSVAERAASVVGYNGKLYIERDWDTNTFVSVREWNDCFIVTLSPVLLPLLTEDELYQLLLREFATILDRNSEIAARFRIEQARFSSDGSRAQVSVRAYYSAISARIDFAVELYSAYSDLLAEQYADEVIRSHGNAQVYINALAKVRLLERFCQFPHREIEYDFFRDEKPSTNYYEQIATLFEQTSLNSQKDKEIVLRRLPSQNDAIPTLKMQMQALQITDFSVTERGVGNYYTESVALMRECGAIRAQWYGWTEIRKKNYSDRNRHITDYEESLQSGKTPDEYTERLALFAYLCIDREKAHAAAERILARDETDLFANYAKAVLLYYEDNMLCFDYAQRAMTDDSVLYQQTCDLLTDAILASGDERLQAKFRTLPTETAKREETRRLQARKKLKLSPKTLLPCDLPKERLSEFKRVVSHYGTELSGVYLAKINDKQGTLQTYLVVLKLPNGKFDGTVREQAIALNSYFFGLERGNVRFSVLIEAKESRILLAAKAVGTSLK